MASVTPAAKKQKRECHFYNKCIKESKGIGKSPKGINQTNNEKVDLQSKISMEYRNRVKNVRN